jgi:hypothetical protein
MEVIGRVKTLSVRLCKAAEMQELSYPAESADLGAASRAERRALQHGNWADVSWTGRARRISSAVLRHADAALAGVIPLKPLVQVLDPAFTRRK